MPITTAILWLLVILAPQAADLNEQLLDAVRKSDAAQVKALLEKGASANAKYRYERGILSFAASRDNAEIVRLLLEKGADPEARDTFYKANALDMASDKAEIRVLLIEKMKPESVGNALVGAAARGQKEVVEAILKKAGLPQASLNTALARAIGNKREEIAAMLKKAGAVEPPKADFQVDEATLRSYAGKYKAEQGEIDVMFKDGKLYAAPAGQQPLTLNAIDKVTFRPGEMIDITVTFDIQDGKVVSVTSREGSRVTTYKRVQ